MCGHRDSNPWSHSGAAELVMALLHCALVVRSALFDASNDGSLNGVVYPGNARHPTVPKGAREYRQGKPLVVRDVNKRPLFSTGLECV